MIELSEQVVEIKAVRHDFFRHLLGFLLVELVLRILDQRQHVAHAQNAARHAVGVEYLQILELFAGAGKFDGLAGDCLDRQRRTASGVAVELGDDDARDLEQLVEALGNVDRVLTGHGVDDEQDLVRLDL